MARTPELPENVRRRNPEGSYVTPRQGTGAPPPVGRGGRRDWSPAQRRWWRALLASNQIHMFEPTDWELAERAVDILIPLAYAGDATGIRELRMAEAELLFSTKSRRAARVDLRPLGGRSKAGKPVETVPEADEPEQLSAAAERIRQRATGGS